MELPSLRNARKSGFTLLEILVAIAVVGLVAAAVLVAVDPVRRVAESRNARRHFEAYSLKEALLTYSLDHGNLPSGIDGTLRMVGTATTGCGQPCGALYAVGELETSPSRLAKQSAETIAARLMSLLAAPALADSPPPASGWVSPDSDQEPAGQWSNPANARDSDLNTYATNTYGGTGWGEYIYFSMTTPINSDRVRVFADYMDAHILEVQVDVLKDGTWTTVFDGGSEAAWNDQWATVTFPAGLVSQVRFRYNYKVGGYQYWLYELQLYKASPTVTPPVCATADASLIQDVAATLHANITDDGGTPDDWLFRYGTTTAYGADTGWTSDGASGAFLTKFVNGLSPNTTYHFNAQVRNSAGQTDCGDLSFTTMPPLTGWVSPAGTTDPSMTWQDGLAATDQDPASYARAYHNINTAQWSEYLYLDHAAIQSNRVRFMARGLGEVNAVEVGVLKDGTWLSVYQGPFTGLTWTELPFPSGLVTQARVRFYATNANTGFYFQLNEFQFLKFSEGTADACLDLSDLAPQYIATIPVDPQLGTPSQTLYAVKRVGSNSVMIYACAAELGENVFSTR